jgi:N-acetyl-anhydromuramyl-L-alanine amidase AmpD
LLLRGGRYYCFDRVSERTLFTGAVYDHGSTWRQQYRYFAAYTPRQVAAVIELVSYLVAHWKISQQTPRNHTRADLKGYLDYQGILAHCHLRPDKTDVHPGFPWLALATECKLRMTP